MRRPRAWPTQVTHSGGAGAPPGVTKDPREELADGMAARLARGSTGLMATQKGPLPRAKGKTGVPRKARPGVVRKTPRWSAERRPRSPKGNAAIRNTDALYRRSIPSFCEGDERASRKRSRGYGLPGAGKNTGASACLPLRHAWRRGGISGNCALRSAPLFGYIRALSRSG